MIWRNIIIIILIIIIIVVVIVIIITTSPQPFQSQFSTLCDLSITGMLSFLKGIQ
jgi:uncharacterized protein YpmS